MIRGFQDSQFMMSSNNADAVTDFLYADWMPADGTTGGETPPPITTAPPSPITAAPPSAVDTVKANILKTDASDEGYVVDPLRKKFEPYIIGGLVAVGVLFLFGMVKVGSETQQVQTVQAK